MRKGEKMLEETKLKIKKSNIETWSRLRIFDGVKNPEAKLTEEEVLFIYQEGKKYKEWLKYNRRYDEYDGLRYVDLKRMFNIHTVGYIVGGTLWSHLTGEPRTNRKGILI